MFDGVDEWAWVTVDDVHRYLTTILEGGSLADTFGPDIAVLLIFVTAAGLLASSSKVGEDEWWFDYLDRIGARFEAAS